MPTHENFKHELPKYINKSTELEGIIHAHDPSIFLFTKTWLKDLICYNEFIEDDLLCSGMIAEQEEEELPFFNKNLIYIRMPDLANVEAFFCKTNHRIVEYSIVVVYEPQSSEFIDLIELQIYMTIHARH